MCLTLVRGAEAEATGRLPGEHVDDGSLVERAAAEEELQRAAAQRLPEALGPDQVQIPPSARRGRPLRVTYFNVPLAPDVTSGFILLPSRQNTTRRRTVRYG